MRLKTIADPPVRPDLIARLHRLAPDAPRRWGTLTAHEMLCHLGDATAMVLGDRPRVTPVDNRPRRVLARAVDGIDRLAAAGAGTRLEPAHGFFGTMSVRDWQRWAWKHTEHHLRQFGA
jgi:hypothetical protein